MLVSQWCYQSGPLKVVSKAFMVLAARLMLSLSSVGFDPSIVSC